MLPTPSAPEIDHRTLKLIVGVIALSIAGLTSLFARTAITSISASYYEAARVRSFSLASCSQSPPFSSRTTGCQKMK